MSLVPDKSSDSIPVQEEQPLALDEASFQALGQSEGHHALALAFARSLSALLGEKDPLILWTAYGLMVDLQEGQSCWTLGQAGARIASLWRRAQGESFAQGVELVDAAILAQRCAQGKAIGAAQSDAPLILDGSRIYLRKVYQAEYFIAAWVNARLQTAPQLLPPEAAKLLPKLFQYSRSLVDDLQAIAAVNAWMAPFALLAGGPGTGKTYTVVNYLALCVLASPAPPKVMLLAPTGKAAARLAESVLKAKNNLDLPDSVLKHIPEEGMTLHRALGLARRDGPSHHRFRPLDADIVVVDESSMVDLIMMAQLLDAVGAQAKLLLVGDANQLASVNAGTVFGDLCQGQSEWRPIAAWKGAILEGIEAKAAKLPSKAPSLSDLRVQLLESRRYDAQAGIALLARALLAGDGQGCVQALEDPAQDQIEWVELEPDAPAMSASMAWASLLPRCKAGYQAYWQAQTPRERLVAKGQFQVLCATRNGHFGVESANAELWRSFRSQRSMDPLTPSQRGMAIMMTRNDYATGLFNGDVGVILAGEQGEGTFAYFEKDAGQGDLHALSLARIGAYEPAFAMTIHKSQGSEYDQVMVVLGAELSPGLNRELLYTAVTRAKQRVCIVASAQVLQACVRNRVQRASGLGARLNDLA